MPSRAIGTRAVDPRRPTLDEVGLGQRQGESSAMHGIACSGAVYSIAERRAEVPTVRETREAETERRPARG